MEEQHLILQENIIMIDILKIKNINQYIPYKTTIAKNSRKETSSDFE